jgi:hypothetical protein
VTENVHQIWLAPDSWHRNVCQIESLSRSGCIVHCAWGRVERVANKQLRRTRRPTEDTSPDSDEETKEEAEGQVGATSNSQMPELQLRDCLIQRALVSRVVLLISQEGLAGISLSPCKFDGSYTSAGQRLPF